MGGVFITFEGVEGCGKSTQLTMLGKTLEARGHRVLLTREPGGLPGQSPAGEAVRRILLDPATGALDPMTELLLFSAVRRELVTKVIAPALEKGMVVICDRFADSTMAYQGFGRGMDKDMINDMNRKVCGAVWPSRTVLLDMPVELGLERANGRMKSEGRGEARFEDEKLEFHKRVRGGFLSIAENEPQRVRAVDASRSVEDVAASVTGAVADVLNEKRGGTK
ncbi:MAG: dTMP kinase [Nitrospinae bacterium]|nr:dTMP kinase [Nitrospinota bacterium]